MHDTIPPMNVLPVLALLILLSTHHQAWYFIEPPSKTKERMIDRRDRAAVIRSDLESKLNRRRTPKEKKVRPGKKGRNLAK